MKQLPFIILLSLFFASCAAQQSEQYTILDTKTYQQELKGNTGVQLIDVRTPEEFASGHLENAVNINVSSSDFTAQAEKLDKEKPVYIYCRSGSRSRNAGKQLEAMGFKTIYDLKGGILSWDGKIVQ